MEEYMRDPSYWKLQSQLEKLDDPECDPKSWISITQKIVNRAIFPPVIQLSEMRIIGDQFEFTVKERERFREILTSYIEDVKGKYEFQLFLNADGKKFIPYDKETSMDKIKAWARQTWGDPVWSKVISVGIIGLITLLWSLL